MIDSLIKEAVEHAQSEFYKNKFYFSYSSLSKLLYNPVLFYNVYVMGIREDKTTQSLLTGKVIHALLLSEDLFNDMFVVSPANLPTGQVKSVVDRVFYKHQDLVNNHGDTRLHLDELEDLILEAMQDVNYYQSLVDDKKTGVTGDRKRLDKILIGECFNYWSFLQSKGSKELIDQETYEYCLNAREILKLNPDILRLLGFNMTEFDDVEVYNEVTFQEDVTKYPFGLKGILDNVTVNHEKKVITINDLKTTSKQLKDFPDSIEYWSYWLQAAIYLTLTYLKFDNLITSGYTVNFNFIVLDGNLLTYVFPVSVETQSKWIDRMGEALDKAKYHYDNKQYELPYEFALGQVIL